MIKKITCYVFTLIFSIPTLFAFGGISHKLLTKSAIVNTKLLEKFPESLEKNLLESCNYPDETWSSFFVLQKPHFVNPFDGFKSLEEQDMYNGEHPNAFISMLDEYNNALLFWRSSKQVESIERLGRAIHYLQDMCCIAHEMCWCDNIKYFFEIDKKLFGGRHVSYENEVDKYIKKNFNTLITEYKNYNFRQNKYIDNTAFSNSMFVKEKFDEKYKSNRYKEIELEEIGAAHKATCELIYLFFKEVGIEL